ncbi:hypothetical protein F5Y18DRAFT_172133 [Xylariaceae sp. FL1019]|nr:hypothetical protein F5Y18DRAFT_172133 [Xylariaceae sp. FL1019]
MNSTLSSAAFHHNSRPSPNTPSTIRTVPSFDTSSDTSYSESRSANNNRLSSSVNSSISAASFASHSPQAHGSYSASRLHPQSSNSSLRKSHPIASQMSSGGGTPRGKENGVDHPSSLQVPDSLPSDGRDFAREGSPQWDGAVGKAGLGKTGRVINKLVSDNEALKRELKIEQLKADEFKQAARLVEDKMERMVQDYEKRLLEANITATLLSRKERQVEALQVSVDLEKQRTADAQEKERTWRVEMETTRHDAKIQVEEATTHAALKESQYNTISSHWKDQGAEVKRAMTTMSGRIQGLVEERVKDDEKISTLRDLCDQQDGNIRDLRQQKQEISRQFEAYKREQEAALRSIKENACKREEEQMKTIEETKQVLHKLKWALNVKNNVAGAQ